MRRKSSTRSLSTRRTNNASQHRLHANPPTAIRHVGTVENQWPIPLLMDMGIGTNLDTTTRIGGYRNQYSMPVYSNDIEAVPDGYVNITIAPKLNYETVTDIIIHLSNQLNDDIKATVHGDTELVIEVNGK